ncbi:hypothetical protein GQ53DRAFT_686303 [Thozetella sp. PMI_491]|nr:hypothetical protein GQ53DRAFT_686303 [Thozetella sp. PMI_491]
MPAKRAAPSTAQTASAKRAKQGSQIDDDELEQEVMKMMRRTRWSTISGSANADAEYWKIVTDDPKKSYSYICICTAPFELSQDDDSDDDSLNDDNRGEHDDKGKPERKRCDGGKTCVCRADFKDHPDHPWVLTLAAFYKYHHQRIHCELRDPDNFAMYTYNDHAGYGVLEVLQNLLVDFDTARASWKEQWIVCQAAVYFLLSDYMIGPMMGCDDPERVESTLRLVGQAFLSMLSKLHAQKLLAENSEVQNLGHTMALYVKMAAHMRQSNFLVDSVDTPPAKAVAKKGKAAKDDNAAVFIYDSNRFDDYVLAYANKFAIPLVGPPDIDELCADCDITVALPTPKDDNADVWSWALSIKHYERCYGVSRPGSKAVGIGGDALDITTWTSAERKKASFDNRDPLGKAERDALKKGLVMQLA